MTVDLKNFIKDENNKKHSKKKKIQKEKLLLDEDTENKDNNIVNKTETNQIHLKKTTQEKYVSERTEKKTQNVKVDSEIDREQSQFFSYFKFNLEIDLLSILLFLIALSVRIYRLKDPQFIIFDELHYGKYISHYMKRTFFFDSHPPLGKQLIAAAAYVAGYDGDFKFDRIGSPYNSDIPLFALRFVPALCGSLIVPVLYQLIIQLGLKQWTALLTGFLILCDNALLTQSRFILMESILLFFSLFSVLCILKFCKYGSTPNSIIRLMWLGLSCISVTCALCVKFVGIYTYFLILTIFFIDFWKLLKNKQYSDFALIRYLFVTVFLLLFVPLCVYTGIFYIHLKTLTKAGPHDSVMTSAFQASLEGGLASITKGQPLLVSHGSQVTLRHTHGRTCWLHSHPHVYPVRYPDKRGSSHQQQVTCYSFKDVNNWWIVKRPHKNNLVVEDITDAIKHGDIVQLVHGITSRALNSHDVAAPISPHCQEVSCYIDYNVSMPAQNLWRVDIVNKEQTGDTWHTIQSHVRLVHVNSSQALRYTGRQLPDWGFNQHEIVTDKVIYQDDTIWNVEEHRYTKSDDQKERERQLVNAEMIPTTATKLSFWDKFKELQYKMMMTPVTSSTEQTHMYSSDPLEWLFMKRGIAYWVSSTSNAQIHLLGNIALWYSASFSLIIYSLLLMFYLLRRRRQCYDIPTEIWEEFIFVGQLFFCGYLFHFLPYFFIERILFLHHYLPAYIFKILLSVYIIEHLRYLLKYVLKLHFIADMFTAAIIVWSLYILFVFRKFIVLSYGFDDLTTSDVLNLRWQDTWDFIIHKS